VCVEQIELPGRLALRLSGANVIENHAARTIAEIEKTHDYAQGGALPVIVFKWHCDSLLASNSM
jgi:hypothetical protein